MKVITTCLYCNQSDVFYVYESETIKARKCTRCGDVSKKIKTHESKDVYGYDSDKPKPDAYIGDDE